MTEDASPQGFRGVTANIGLKPIDDDFVAILSAVPARSAAIFTCSRFAGPSVKLSRASALARRSRGIAVLAGNANVATGPLGAEHAIEVRSRVAKIAEIPPNELILCSTGTIGRPYPIDAVRRSIDGLTGSFASPDFDAAAAAMMTGDTRPKSIRLRCGDATLVGIAKGGGIVEHDRRTLLAFFFSDADLPVDESEPIFERVMARTFNGSSLDADTATSDTAALFANGLAGRVRSDEFERALEDAALYLARQIASENDHAEMRFVEEGALAVDDARV